MMYRDKFHGDVVLDVVGYRRHGHNEGDEPAYTQPVMYERIKQTPTVRQRYAEQLAREGVVAAAAATTEAEQTYQRLADIQQSLKANLREAGAGEEPQRISGAQRPPPEPETAVSTSLLTTLNEQLLRRGARGAGVVGGAVRRLPERRRGDHRSVPHRRPRQVGTDLPPHAAVAARLRGPGAGALERPGRAVPCARRRRQSAHRQLHHAGAVLPPAAASGTPPGAAAAGPLHAQEPAAPSPGDRPARRPDRWDVPAGAGRPRGRGASRRDAAGAVQRQGLLRPAAVAAARVGGARRDRPRRAAVPVPRGRARGADQALSQNHGDRLGAGGAPQHGAAEVHAAAIA